MAVTSSLLFWAALLWLLWMLVNTARAEPQRGLDLLALATVDPVVVGQELDPDSALGWLVGTFGNANPKAAIVLNSGKVTAVRVHLASGVCIRNGNCAAGEIRYRSLDELRKRAISIKQLMSAYPTVKVYLSPFLEHDSKDKALIAQWFKVIKEACPTATPVCSAFTGFCPMGVLKEKHGNEGRAAIRSNDGDSIFDSDSIKYRNSGSVLTMSWIPENNNRVSGEKTFTPPQKRPHLMTKELLRQQVRILREPPAFPVVGGCSVISPPEIGKVNAERYLDGDARGNKFLFISSRQVGSTIKVTKTNGNQVGHLKYYGPFVNNLQRYYIGTGSSQKPTELMDDLGSEWGVLRWGSGCRVFNAIRRAGSFR